MSLLHSSQMPTHTAPYACTWHVSHSLPQALQGPRNDGALSSSALQHSPILKKKQSMHLYCDPLHSCAPRTYPLATTEQRYVGTTFRQGAVGTTTVGRMPPRTFGGTLRLMVWHVAMARVCVMMLLPIGVFRFKAFRLVMQYFVFLPRLLFFRRWDRKGRDARRD